MTYEVFLSQPNSFLAIILQTANSGDSTQFNSSAPKLISWQAGVSKLDSARLNGFKKTLLYKYFARTTQKTQPLYCWEGVFTALLHSDGCYLIVACVFVTMGMCLPNRCLAVKVYSDFAIPAFVRHVTVSIYITRGAFVA
jgi:hypothetical protein